MRYPTLKIGEFAKVKGGKRLPKGENLVANKTAHPYIRARDIRDGNVTFDDPTFVPDEVFERIKRYTVKTNDVCITIVGANVGDVGIVPQFLDGANLTENAVKLTNLKDCDPFYLKYGLMLDSPQEQMKLLAAGAAQPKLGLYKVKEVKIPFPPLPTQRKIAAILSAYDDLIENNTRRIAILEDMSQAIYREWFVHFRFPGHEDVRMVESELGPVPEGWEVRSLGEISSYINRGIAPKYDDESESIVVNQKCIRNNRLNLNLARRHSRKVPDPKYVKFGDVLVNSTGIGTLGRVAQVYQDIPDCTVDTHVTIVRPGDQVNVDYYGLCLLDLQSYFDHHGAGSTGQTELRRQVVEETQVLLPPIGLQKVFSEIVFPMRKSMVSLTARNETLRQTRDLLLPRLVSGELDVSGLEIEVEGLDG